MNGNTSKIIFLKIALIDYTKSKKVEGVHYALPILKMLVWQVGQVPLTAGLPFFRVTEFGL